MRWACATLDGCTLEIPEPDASGLRDAPAPAAPPNSENAARAARSLSSARCDGPVLRSTVARLKYLSRTHRAYETHRRPRRRHIRKTPHARPGASLRPDAMGLCYARRLYA